MNELESIPHEDAIWKGGSAITIDENTPDDLLASAVMFCRSYDGCSGSVVVDTMMKADAVPNVQKQLAWVLNCKDGDRLSAIAQSINCTVDEVCRAAGHSSREALKAWCNYVEPLNQS